MPVRRLGAGHAQHLTCERAYSGYEIGCRSTINRQSSRRPKEVCLINLNTDFLSVYCRIKLNVYCKIKVNEYKYIFILN